MALVLQFTQEWLRAKNGWIPQQCGVQPGTMPPNDAGPFYVGIDDGGVEGSPDSTEDLQEIITLSVGVWRKPEHLFIKDQRNEIKMPAEKYVLGAFTLSDLERLVIVPRKNGLHKNNAFLAALNSRYDLPHAELGDAFRTSLVYKGRSQMEYPSVDLDGTNSQPWYGYRLRFRGLLRVQRVNDSNYCVG